MWERTKRLINSYLDDLVERVSSPDRGARDVTRAEVARLNELEVQTRASAKLFEKELAEVELKITGALERERLMRDRGDEVAASAAANEARSFAAQQILLKQQLAEAYSAADRAKALRDQRKVEGEDLATETHLTAMRENLSALDTPFRSTDPAATLDEMRARLARSGVPTTDARVAEADRELEEARARARVEETLARYKQGLTTASAPAMPEQPAQADKPAASISDEEAAPAEKTLGRTDGPLTPID